MGCPRTLASMVSVRCRKTKILCQSLPFPPSGYQVGHSCPQQKQMALATTCTHPCRAMKRHLRPLRPRHPDFSDPLRSLAPAALERSRLGPVQRMGGDQLLEALEDADGAQDLKPSERHGRMAHGAALAPPSSFRGGGSSGVLPSSIWPWVKTLCPQ